MDIKRKIEIAKLAVRSISRHDDADRAVRAAALKAIQDFIEDESVEADERIADKIADATGQEL